jgi:DNA invertase Pin-like site-specific DNA recombinase
MIRERQREGIALAKKAGVYQTAFGQFPYFPGSDSARAQSVPYLIIQTLSGQFADRGQLHKSTVLAELVTLSIPDRS